MLSLIQCVYMEYLESMVLVPTLGSDAEIFEYPERVVSSLAGWT